MHTILGRPTSILMGVLGVVTVVGGGFFLFVSGFLPNLAWSAVGIILVGSTLIGLGFRSWLVAAASATVCVCLVLKVMTAGWFLILPPYLPGYELVGIAHFFVHARASRRTPLPAMTMIVSDVLLLLAFLLQFDSGDGRPWLTITALGGEGPGSEGAEPPAWWSELFNPLMFLPVLGTWILLWRRNRP